MWQRSGNKTKIPRISLSGGGSVIHAALTGAPRKSSHNFFSHPDYTVGFGISPNQLLSQVADYTAGGESHPAPKNLCSIYFFYISIFFLKMQVSFNNSFTGNELFYVFYESNTS